MTEAITIRETWAALALALPEIRTLAPKYCNPERLVAIALQAQMHNPLLAQCTPASVVAFCKRCAEVGTDRIGAGGMWPVPFRRKDGGYDMTPIPDWRLMVEKAKRAKAIKHATADAVYAADEFRYSRGLAPELVHVPARCADRGDLVAAYCVYVLPDGERDFVVMERAEVDAIRARSKARDAGPWVTDFSEMAKKTAVKRAMKTFDGASIELTRAIETDNEYLGYGAIDIDARPPVAMPRLKEPQLAATEEQPKPQQPQAAEPPAATNKEPAAPDTLPMDNDTSVVGIIDAIKKAPTKTGGTRYGIQVAGTWYGTFDTALGDIAEREHQTGSTVRLSYTERGQYRDAVRIEVAQ
jgi:recombination protein RecT